MTTPAGYLRQIKELDQALKRYNLKTKELREKKKLAQHRLYKYMARRELDEYEGIRISSIAPKEKKIRKKAKDKKQDAIRLFAEAGIPDPVSFWDDFQSTQV